MVLGSFCYEFNSMEDSWTGASKACKDRGGELMSVHTPDEQALLSLSTGKFGLVLIDASTNWEFITFYLFQLTTIHKV